MISPVCCTLPAGSPGFAHGNWRLVSIAPAAFSYPRAKATEGKADRAEAVGPMSSDLFDLPPYQSHSDTSRNAAVAIVGDAGTLRRKVYEAIFRAGSHGMTDEELQTSLGMNPSTERPRRVELVEGKAVVDSQRRRHTRSGRQAVVWVAVSKMTEAA